MSCPTTIVPHQKDLFSTPSARRNMPWALSNRTRWWFQKPKGLGLEPLHEKSRDVMRNTGSPLLRWFCSGIDPKKITKKLGLLIDDSPRNGKRREMELLEKCWCQLRMGTSVDGSEIRRSPPGLSETLMGKTANLNRLDGFQPSTVPIQNPKCSMLRNVFSLVL